MRKTNRLLIAVALLVALGTATASADMTGEYYLTRWWLRHPETMAQVHVVHGSAIARQWATVNPFETTIAVSGTVRTTAEVKNALFAERGDGHQYTTSGEYTGVSFANESTFTGDASDAYFSDGTTDGQYNYAVDTLTGGVFRFDMNWANPVRLFYAPQHVIGITYDPANDSLWFSSYDDNAIRNYDLAGNQLSWFPASHTENAALALDYSDGTLWFQNYLTGDLEQWSRSGEQLSTVNFYGSYYSGGEFDFVVIPAPGAVVLGAVGTSLVATLRRRLS